MLVNQEFLIRLLNSSEFFAPRRPARFTPATHPPVVTSIEKQYQQQKKTNQTKQHKTKTDDKRNSCALSCSSKCTCCSTCMDHRPSSLPSPSPSRARGCASGRSDTVARQRLHRPSLCPRWRVRYCTRGRTGPWFPPPGGAPHGSREPEKRKPPSARPPARQLAPKRKRKIKGEKGEGGSTWKILGGVFHVLVCVHNNNFF